MLENSVPKSARAWRIVAEEAAHEHDAEKMADLLRELNQALEEQGLISPPGSLQKKSA